MKKRNVILLVLLLVIGFAAVSTTLVLNGTIGIGSNTNDFDVIFTDALVDGDRAKSLISEDKKSITFASNKITEVGETSVLEYKVKNNSTQYGADVTISCNTTGNEYVSITGEFDGKDIPLTNPITMEAQEVKNGSITAKLIKAYSDADTSISVECKIVASASEKEEVTDYTQDVYKEDILNGTDPVLVSTKNQSARILTENNLSKSKDLIPVTLANDGTVTYADITKKWYSYENKEWANAVILKDGVTHNVGEVIPEEDIESYFVWIPKYRYKLFDMGEYDSAVDGQPEKSNAKTIEIEFNAKDTTDRESVSCKTPMESGESGNCEVGEWMTHPAFITMNTTGLWVGKFETGYDGATSIETAEVDEIDSSKIIVKPNVYSWRKSTIGNVFKTAYNYNRELDSHMMKNTEWGAVAYLSHSKYGINTEININNNSNYLTGYSAVEGTDQSSYPGEYGTDATKTLPYNTETGYKASTTGNITGIYDMSGGAHEYMASYKESFGVKNSATVVITYSGFTEEELIEYERYLDKYSISSNGSSWNKRILGDATGEIGQFYNYAESDGNSRYHNSWYNDDSGFIDSLYPWFSRGCYYNHGVLAGSFNFFRRTGDPFNNISSRLVLAP